MFDWTSLPVGIAAYLGGLITKPIQNWYETKKARAELRQALYVEIANLLSRCVLTLQELDRDPAMAEHFDIYANHLWPCSCYEHAKTMPVVLNLLPDATGIISFYGGLEAIAAGYKFTVETKKPPIWYIPIFIQSMRGFTFTIENKLDKKLLLELGDERTAAFLAGLELEKMAAAYHELAKMCAPPPAPPRQ